MWLLAITSIDIRVVSRCISTSNDINVILVINVRAVITMIKGVVKEWWSICMIRFDN